ncbi:hypothetical protein [Halobacillus trueperi]|uniref:Uncharacterized protein n=1 Tax=Halobacillus trueperi TaxID=156205 RepID=A0A3E0JEE8_9BACI|nr:hypothetical protein [Halobacillus trueperi]REJ11230.1 hypothetical protein DYE48_02220 [Halobacillus trueperi]
MALWFEREAGETLFGLAVVTLLASIIILFMMKGRKDKRPFGWVLAHVIFSALSVGWTLQSLKPRSSEDELQSMALAAVSFQLGSAAFIWCHPSFA